MLDLVTIPKYVINLSDRSDRLNDFDKQFHSFFINDSYKVIRATRMSPGYVGCAMSHLSAVNAALGAGYDYMIVMEDDCVFNGSLSKEYADFALQTVPNHFDMLLGGLYFRRTSGESVGEWDKLTKFSGNHFCIISKQGMLKLSHFNCDTHIDHWCGLNLNCYSPKRFFAMQQIGYSDIAKKKVDYSDLIKGFDIV